MTAEWDDLARHAEVARDEAPQEWRAKKIHDGVYAMDLSSRHQDSDSYGVGDVTRLPREVAQFIAAANPATILRLIRELRESQMERTDLLIERDQLAARLTAVEALADEYARDDAAHLGDFGQHHPVAGIAHDHLRAALAAPTDTTKEN